MRFLGTLMLLAAVAMLLVPALWERHSGDSTAAPAAAGPAPLALQAQSTLRVDDLVPEWRGPSARH